MPSSLEKLSTNRAKLTVDMSFEELKPSLDKAYKQIADQVSVPGFRKGKVPAPVIDQRFGRGAVLQEAINDALPDAYGKAIEEHDLVPLGQPEIEVTKLEDGEVVQFTAELDIRPDFEVPDFSDISVQVDNLEVKDSDVDDRVEMLRQRFATNTEVDRPAAEGDLVQIDMKGFQDDEPLEDATAEGVTYKIGSGGMLEGLDEAVTGMKAGEEKTFTSTLVGGEHKGEKADIKVTVSKVEEQELPEVDDDFAQLVSQFDTVDEMRADLATSVENMARLDQTADARDKVLEEVIGKIDIDLPQNLLDSQIEARHQQIQQELNQAGMTVSDYIERSDEDIEDEDAFWAEIEKRTIDTVKAQIVLDKVADDEEIGVEQDELTQLLFRKAQQNGTSPEQEAQHMLEHNHMQEWMQEIRRGKALAQMVQAATVTDADGTTLDISSVQADGSIREEEPKDDSSDEGEKKDAPEKAEKADESSEKKDDETTK